MKHSEYMLLAIEEAKTAFSLGETPVGCVIVKNDKIIGKGHNTRETKHTALGHAELSAIDEACQNTNSWRLSDCTIYVTMEPCPMCMGAILNARIKLIVFGAYDFKAGCCGSAANFNSLGFNYKTQILGGIQEKTCSKLLSEFFKKIRK